jgi:2-polyprenyl-6-methoxyphenol hydroxylase-like FAD-dependent oxidoreductase
LYDVVVAGGTLGVFVAVSLAQRGLRVAVLERGKLAGRTQEWNISRKELLELVEVRTHREGLHVLRQDWWWWGWGECQQCVESEGRTRSMIISRMRQLQLVRSAGGWVAKGWSRRVSRLWRLIATDG